MAALCCSIGNAQQIIYSNSFSGGPTTLNGTAPTMGNSGVGGTNTAVWTCTFSNGLTGFTNSVDGTVLANGTLGTNAGSALLPFKVQSGAFYFLTASLYLPAANNWIGLGFSQNATPSTNASAERFTDPNVKGNPWMDIREGNAINFFGGPETSLGSAATNAEPSVGTYTLTIILNTLAAKWATAAYVNGVIQGTNVVGGAQLGTNIVYATNPPIGYVGLTQQAITAGDAIQWNYVALSTALLPIITQQPVSGAAYAGAAVTNTAAAIADTNGGPLLYQWYTNGVPIAGATNTALVLDRVMATDASTNYYVVVTNSYGAATSAVTSLTVSVTNIPPIIWTNVQTPFWVEVGGSVSNSIAVVGSPPLSYQWQFNGTNLTDDGRITGSQTNVLSIAGAQDGDAGGYQVIVTNSYGSITSSVAALTVVGAQPIGFNGYGPGWTSNQAGPYVTSAISNSLLTLTDGAHNEARSFFFGYPQYIGAFKAAFTYQAAGSATADGVTFCLQNDPRGASALGGIGGAYGVGTNGAQPGITPSAELELNIYPLSAFGAGYCFETNGIIGTNALPGNVNLTNGPIDILIYYASGQMALTFSNEHNAAVFSTNLMVGDLTQVLGNNTAYLGFTGSDGGATSIQTITNFSFVSIPAAAIQLSGANALISWPGSIIGYGLQQNANLNTTNWVNITNQAVFTNGSYQATVPVGASSQFYRLILQP